MNTTRIIRKSQPSKLSVPAEDAGGQIRYDQLEFTISDGQYTLRGFYTTRSVSDEELDVALAVIRREFCDQCERAGYEYRV